MLSSQKNMWEMKEREEPDFFIMLFKWNCQQKKTKWGKVEKAYEQYVKLVTLLVGKESDKRIKPVHRLFPSAHTQKAILHQ